MDVYHPVQPNITDPNLKPYGSRISSAFMPTSNGFIQNHYIAIICAVVVVIILLVILYVYLTRKSDKKKDESLDYINDIDSQELERLQNLRKQTKGEPQILQRHVMQYDNFQPVVQPQPVQLQPVVQPQPVQLQPVQPIPLKHEPPKQPEVSDKATYDLDAFINSLNETSN